MFRFVCVFAFLLLVASPGTARAEVHAWIFAGQSNMRGGQGQYASSMKTLVESKGHTLLPIFSSAPGKPISRWLNSDEKEYADLWTRSLLGGITDAKRQGATFKGMVWYQGESDSDDPLAYAGKLNELISRVRKETGVADLPVIVIQLAALVGYDAQPPKSWGFGLVREAQRRVIAGLEGRGALVTAVDCEVGDYTVHLKQPGHAIVAKRIVAAASHLAYGGPAHGWGPQFHRAYIADGDRKTVVVEFDHVQGEVKLGKGWRQAFGLSTRQAPLPRAMADAPPVNQWAALHESWTPAAGARAEGNRVVLLFDKPVAEGAALSFCANTNAKFGMHRLWGLEFDGVGDASGQHASAFTLVPIGAKPADAPAVAAPARADDPSTYSPDEPFQIAVNCIGRMPDAVLPPDAEAGAPGWRQRYWNPASSNTAVNLLDSKGRVGPVALNTSVWYMSPYFTQLKSPDDALMASWCKSNSGHTLTGLAPHTAYDLTIYLLQGPDPKESDKPTHRAVRVALFHADDKGRKPRDGSHIAEHMVNVPAEGKFDGYIEATKANDFTGNFVVFESVKTDAAGRLGISIDLKHVKQDGQIRWGDTTLAGVQIRKR